VIGVAVTAALLGVPTMVSSAANLANVANGDWLAAHSKIDSVQLISLGIFVSRLLAAASGSYSGWILGPGRSLITVLTAIALTAVTVHATLARPGGRDRGERSFALWVVTTVLLSPTAWVHYMVLLLVPFARLVAAVNLNQASRRALWIGAASYVLTQISPAGLAAVNATLPATLAKLLVQSWFPCATLLAYGSAYCLAID